MANEELVQTVWIDNPPVNAISLAVAEGIGRALADLPASTRVVVLRGRGEKAFSAGAELTSILDDGSPPGRIQPLGEQIEALPVPVIAAIHGHCLGGGLELALACDLRIAHVDARLALPEVGLGLIPGGGGTQRAPRLIGPGRAARLMLTGERIGAAQAEAWGLVEQVVDDLDAGIAALAGTIADQSPNAVRALKQLLRATREHADYAAELTAFARCLTEGEGREGIASFLEKRAPGWRSR